MKPKQATAYDFHLKIIEPAPPSSIFKILTDELDYYFFSHMHDVKLESFTKMDTILHFFDFFEFLIHQYEGSDVTSAYASYYVKISLFTIQF